MSEFRQENQAVSHDLMVAQRVKARELRQKMFSTRTEVKREPCRRCQILRVYIAMVIGVVVFGVLAHDLLDKLTGLKPAMFGWAFAGLPILLFAFKFGLHKKRQQLSTRHNKNG